ncbi:MAG: hypothetical protein R3F29_02770 [Planctomycetota bacterium]
MSPRRSLWRQLLRAESPSADELRSVERELGDHPGEPLAAHVIERLTREITDDPRFRRHRRRGRLRGLLLLVSMLLALASTASVGARIYWPQEPARLPTAPLDEAFDLLARRDASKSELQLAMGVLDRHVFQALTTLKQLATTDAWLGKTAAKALEQLHVARQPAPRPSSCDVTGMIATATNTAAPHADRLAALHAMAGCIAAGVTALQAVELAEEDLRIAREVYARRLLRDIEKAAAAAAEPTRPAASDSPPKAPGTQPSAR